MNKRAVEEGRGQSRFYSASDGLRLHAVDYGHGNRDPLPVVCLAGLSRNTRDFERLAIYLSEAAEPKRRVVCFDYRGRGLSDHDPDWKNYNIVTEAEDVIAGMAALDISHAAFVGTSRGGLIAMALSAMRPALMRAVVLNDVGPVIEMEGLAAIQAMLSRPPQQPKDWGEAIAMQKAAMEEDFPGLGEEDWEFEAHAKYRAIDGGPPRPDFDPELAKTLSEIDFSRPLPAMWPQFIGLSAVPVLVLRGENSALLSRQTLEDMTRQHPGLEAMEIGGQGHAPMVHTAGIPQAIEKFLARADD